MSTTAAARPVGRVRSGWAMALLVVAALEFAASYRGFGAPVVMVAAALVPFGLVKLGQLARAGTFVSALVAIVISAAVGWVALHRSSGALGGIGDAVPRLLTTARPAPGSAALLAPPALLVALIAAVVAAVVLAPERADGRFTGLLAPAIGAVVVYTGAQLLSAGAADAHGIVAVCLLVMIAAGWSLPYVSTLGGRGSRLSWRPTTAVPVLVVVLLALGVTTLQSSSRYDPRRHVTPPTVKLTEDSPLSQLSSWTANPSVTILQVNAKGTGRLHLATLDEFTGDSWRVDSKYQELGLVAHGDLPVGRHRSTASATIQVVRLGGVWLPAPGAPESSSLSDALIDPDNGTLARARPASPGLRYDVTSTVENATDDQLATASVPASVPSRYLALPDAPVAFATYARAAVRGASSPLEEAVALENAVSTGRTLDPKAPSGSSYGRLSTFLFGAKGSAGAQAGTDEQFAAGFAVLAREVGLPSRLTVGFVLGKPAANGTITVHGADATVWPELYLQGIGWVPFAPSPNSDQSADQQNLRNDVLQRLSQQVAQLPPPDPPIIAQPAKPGQQQPQGTAGAKAKHHSAGSGLPGWLLAVVVVVGVLVLLVIGLVALRARRRARHRRAGARGAWAEVEDLLLLMGQRPAVGRTAPDLAAEADAALGMSGTTAVLVAQAADREAYAPAGAPPAGTVADLWPTVRVLRRRARSAVPARRRLLMPLDPRPLLRR